MPSFLLPATIMPGNTPSTGEFLTVREGVTELEEIYPLRRAYKVRINEFQAESSARTLPPVFSLLSRITWTTGVGRYHVHQSQQSVLVPIILY